MAKGTWVEALGERQLTEIFPACPAVQMSWQLFVGEASAVAPTPSPNLCPHP